MSQVLSLGRLVEIRKQNALEETEEPEPEPEPEPKERTVTVLKLTAGHGLAQVGIKVSEDNDWNEYQILDKEL
jgi:hypothetical protein